ncbi:MAG: hypothetical protein QM496_20080 [Verrucomicrobiota bacterium]
MSTTKEAVIEILLPVVERLEDAEIPFVLIGGITVPFYFSDLSIDHFRPTKDVDVIVAATQFLRFEQVEEKLRRVGFRNHPEVIHRWLLGATLVDIMPASSDLMDTINRWYPITFATAEPFELSPAQAALMASPACFLATKMEAFANRGGGDFLGSHDLEDIVSVIDGRPAIVEEVESRCPFEVREFIRDTTKRFLSNHDFMDALEGHLPQEHREPKRLQALIERMQRLSS